MTTLRGLQEEMDLAAIEVEDRDVLISMAGAQGIHAFELKDAIAVAVAFEPLDPSLPPSRLEIAQPLDLAAGWEADDFITGSLTPLSSAALEDLEAAARWSWLRGDAPALHQATGRYLLRVEAWQLEPQRADLCVVIGASSLHVHDEEGEVRFEDEPAPLPPAASPGHPAPPTEPPFALEDHDVPADLLTPVRDFFELHHAGKWGELARVHPRLGDDHEFRTAWLAAHFVDLHEWGYARAVEGWWQEGRLAHVQLRGIQHCLEEDAMDSHSVECVWSFSLLQRDDTWIVRNWAQAWPSMGGAPELPLANKPWLSRWSAGPVE